MSHSGDDEDDVDEGSDSGDSSSESSGDSDDNVEPSQNRKGNVNHYEAPDEDDEYGDDDDGAEDPSGDNTDYRGNDDSAGYSGRASDSQTMPRGYSKYPVENGPDYFRKKLTITPPANMGPDNVFNAYFRPK